MQPLKHGVLTLILMLSQLSSSALSASAQEAHDTPHYRPSYHFTPQRHWMNDPNGLVFHNGTYHLFFQHYPKGITWGPMHWGHATSQDLTSWQEHPIALAPDELGMIFSGSVVIDQHNTSNLGKLGQAPWVAIFTHHDDKAQEAGRTDVQHQSLAYSLDQGMTWVKYAGNPVLKNPGIKDLRDPKVFWHEASAQWIMSLAAHDRIQFYSSSNLKDWHKESEFGADAGSHEGVWECPDLVSLRVEGDTRWVLIVSLVAGGPNGGSATQYFVGDFDGRQFTPEHQDIRWLDQGPDNYAGVTWHNTGERTVFIGWMSNWVYAKEVPTSPWRSAMTLPRDLGLRKVNDQHYLTATPSSEVLQLIHAAPKNGAKLSSGEVDLSHAIQDSDGRLAMEISAPELDNFCITLSNDQGDQLTIDYNRSTGHYQVDRRQSGVHEFNDKFPQVLHAKRINASMDAHVTLYFDRTSVELFADHGLTVMTSLFFPKAPYTRAMIQAEGAMRNGQVSWQKAW